MTWSIQGLLDSLEYRHAKNESQRRAEQRAAKKNAEMAKEPRR
jgi:hypothetical protein